MPSKNKIFFFLEGSTEQIYLDDFLGRYGHFIKEIDNEEITYGIVHMNQLANEYEDSNEEYDEVVVILDNDDQQANIEVKKVKVMAKRIDAKLTVLKQKPLIETFLAAHFNDFVINENWTEQILKQKSVEFMCNKFEVDSIRWIKKKMTLTNIIKKGGNYSNALRYKHRFNIMKILVFV